MRLPPVRRLTRLLPLLLIVFGLACGGAGAERGLALEGAPAARSSPRVWTVAVGVSVYRESALNLRYAARDAEEIDRFFASSAGGSVPSQRRVLLTDARATRADILGAIEHVTRSLAKDDLLVVFLAMHGMVNDKGDLYFVTHDTTTTNLRGTALANRDVEQSVRDADAKQVLFLADACHSGGVGLSNARGVAAAETNRLIASLAAAKPGTAILSASRGAELSQEDPRWGGGHGVFTHFLLEGMSGQADENTDGLVTVSELYDFVYGRVKDATMGAQHPELKGSFSNDMAIAQRGGASPAAGAAKPGASSVIPASPPARPGATAVSAPPPRAPPAPPVAEMFVIDLTQKDRQLIEQAVRTPGIAVVTYGASGLTVLADCRAPGRYEIVQENAVQTESARSSAEQRMLLPLAGERFDAARRANGSLSLRLARLGYYTARDYLAERGPLRGTCANASHLIRKLAFGTFTIRSGDELLTQGGEASACSSTAPDQCVGLRVTLVPLR
jgi:uncharacterized caspase-like protein